MITFRNGRWTSLRGNHHFCSKTLLATFQVLFFEQYILIKLSVFAEQRPKNPLKYRLRLDIPRQLVAIR